MYTIKVLKQQYCMWFDRSHQEIAYRLLADQLFKATTLTVSASVCVLDSIAVFNGG